MLLVMTSAWAGPVPMFGRPAPVGGPQVFVVMVVPPNVPDPARALPGKAATTWALPEGPRPASSAAGPSVWQQKRTAVEQPGRFVSVDALGEAFSPLSEAANALEP